jgi:outer membrane protein assembly factor BamB
MSPRRVAVRMVCVVACAVLLGACTDWSTWGNGTLRSNENVLEKTVSPSNVASLTQKWSVSLGRQINASPILAHNIDVNGTPTTLLYTGTEDGNVYAVSTSGAIVWTRSLPTVAINCTEMYTNGVHGVSASPVYDATRHRIYVVSGNGYLYALDAATGGVIPGWPIQLTTIPTHEVVWDAPALVGNNLYVGIASHCDSQPYKGRIIDVDPDTHAIAHTFYTMGSATGPDGGGIWGWGGVSIDPRDNDVYAATGNSFATPENSPYADGVLRLTSALAVKSYYTPTPLIGDDDFGTSPVLFQKEGCPPQLAVIQKNGSLFLFDRDSIASGPRQRVAFGVPELIGVASYSTATQMLYVVNGAPSDYKQGVAAFRFDANCKLALAWNTFLPITGSAAPVIANGVVYVSGGLATKIYALNATTGAKLWDSGTAITDMTFPSPIIVDGHVYAVAYDGKLHAFGL